MQIVRSIPKMQSLCRRLAANGKRIGLVPTLRFLHDGHLSLIKIAKKHSDIVITTIFVNPTQFAPNEDYERYPRDFERDTEIAENNGTDILFYPSVSEMYPKEYNTAMLVSGITKKFEGEKRPGHFNGVATIVAKLFNCVKPHLAVFGQKDYQQTLVIKQLVRDMLFGVDIVVAPTVREPNGLAMSSRNVYLGGIEREQAGLIYNALEAAIEAIENGENRRKILNAHIHNILRSSSDIRIDYALAADADTLDEPDFFLPGQHVVLLVAVYLGKTRLIDNGLITIPEDPAVKPHMFV